MKQAINNILVAVVAISATLLPVSETSAADTKPNIVLINMDNLGYGELGVYGGGIVRGGATPRIDQLASQGLRLTNFNVEAQCTPSRAALMTGRYGVRSGNGSVPISTFAYGLTQWEYTMPEMLHDAGYATAMFGKWHLGQTKGRYPTDQGFDEWYGIPNSTDESLWPAQEQFQKAVASKETPFLMPEHIMEAKKGETPIDVKLYEAETTRREIDRACPGRGDFWNWKICAGICQSKSAPHMDMVAEARFSNRVFSTTCVNFAVFRHSSLVVFF